MEEVYLEDVVKRLDVLSDEWHTFFDRRSNTFLDISEEAMRVAEYYGGEADLTGYPDWQREDIRQAVQLEREWTEGNYVSFPTPFDIHEYSIMEEFSVSVKDRIKREKLLQAICGKGAFRRFKDSIHQMDLAESWYAFREQAYLRIAQNWCEENHILYKRRDGGHGL